VIVLISLSLITHQTLPDSTYKAWLKINSNDPTEPVISVPVTLIVSKRNQPPVVGPLPDTSFLEDDSLMLDLDDYVEDPDDPDSSLTWTYSVYGTSGGEVIPAEYTLGNLTLYLSPKIEEGKRDLIDLSRKPFHKLKISGRADVKSFHFIKGIRYKEKLPVVLEDGPIYIEIDSLTHIATMKADPNWNGSFNVIFTATDPGGLSDSDTMFVEVVPVNDPPVITDWGPPSPDTVEVSDTLYISAEDIDNDSLIYIWSVNGTVDNSAQDTFYIYTPTKPGVDTVISIVSDGELADSVEWIIIAQPKGIMEYGRELPRVFSLSQNSPNPFRGSTKILYTIAFTGSPNKKSYVMLRVYNITGKLIRTLVDQAETPGYYRVIWDGRDDYGRKVPAGIYFYRLKADSKIIGTKKLILLR